MAIRRTREDKQKAALKRQTQPYVLKDIATLTPEILRAGDSKKTIAPSSISRGSKSRENNAEKIIGYPAGLIYQDLVKTVVITLLVFGAVFGLQFYFK